MRTEDDHREFFLGGIKNTHLGGFEKGRERRVCIGRGGDHWLELRRQFVAQQGDQSTLKVRPAREAGRPHLARPTSKIIKRTLQGLLMRALLVMHHDATIHKEDGRAGGAGHRQSE